MQLQKAGGKVAALHEGGAAPAARLLVAEGDDRTGACTLDRLDRRDDAERAVELPTCGNGVEVRAGPDGGVRCPADQIPRSIYLHLETRLAHPAGRELVGLVLGDAVPGPVRTDAAADRIELVEPLEDARLYSPNGLYGFVPVETRTLLVSR